MLTAAHNVRDRAGHEPDAVHVVPARDERSHPFGRFGTIGIRTHPEWLKHRVNGFEAMRDHLQGEIEEESSDHPLMRLFRLPTRVMDALAGQAWGSAIALARAAGYDSENDLTNIVFYFRHPEAAGRKIQRHETDLTRSWLEIRDTIVRPALRAAPATGAPAHGKISAAGLAWYGPGTATPELMAFMRAVFERHMATSKGSFVDSLPGDTLGRVDKMRLRADAAEAAQRMLDAARAALAAAGLAGRTRIGLTSAYRSAWRQFEIWQGKDGKGKRGFPYYYAESAADRRATGDPHGPQSVEILTKLMRKYIAAPGYSNHQDGLAVDLGTGSGPSGGLRRIKRTDWFHRWLSDNAATYHFEPYPAEAWHWVYRGSANQLSEDEFEGDEGEGRLF
ncbi:D-alanyl-D-alanine carboxypeptidase family protein [Actinoplanes auranticolor]|uniref:D-alanyl-D-alanine carboxypeptidase-like core domain-containing protein n=1 Tax=Actinoplanes auranticolor TaxID=47988 RepID=A0A919VVJ4_9ACTN|nr:M15 family metallopeptidase [Actinoplanes auranticolor]GIM80649.1 hypothetical protein Aau02nite_91540 [Actinoplanes auranticolor]